MLIAVHANYPSPSAPADNSLVI